MRKKRERLRISGKRLKDKEGYMTVEASFLIPITCMILLLVIHFSFFCLNSCITTQKLFLIALHSSNQWEMSKEDKKKEIEKEWEEVEKQLLIAVDQRELKIENCGKTIRLSFSGTVIHDEKDRMQWGIKEFQLKNTMEATTVYPAKWIRKLEKGIKYIDDGDEIKNGI